MSNGFRHQAKRFFLTFPQCETTKQAASDNLQAKWGEDLEAYAIAAEHHEPTEEDPVGGPHLHMVIHFKEKKHFRSPDCFDFITGKHGDYQIQKGRLCDVAIGYRISLYQRTMLATFIHSRPHFTFHRMQSNVYSPSLSLRQGIKSQSTLI